MNLTKNGFDDFSFYWVDVREQSALSKVDMVSVYDRLIIEVDAGGVAPYLDEDDELLSSEEDSSSW